MWAKQDRLFLFIIHRRTIINKTNFSQASHKTFQSIGFLTINEALSTNKLSKDRFFIAQSMTNYTLDVPQFYNDRQSSRNKSVAVKRETQISMPRSKIITDNQGTKILLLPFATLSERSKL